MDIGLRIMEAKYEAMEKADTPSARMLAHDSANLAMVLVAIIAGVRKEVKPSLN